MTPALRSAQKNDLPLLTRFLNSQINLHRHLDWRDTLEWLGREPFLLLEEETILAALACPPEPDQVAWVRLFATSQRTSPDRAWRVMFARALEYLNAQPEPSVVVSLAMRTWYEDLLKRNHFRHYQDIVVYKFDEIPPPAPPLPAEYQLRPLLESDLREVERIDHLAFEPIWRLSTGDLQFAYRKSSYSTVVECDGEIVAYQMSSSGGIYAHLARLAVNPLLQGRKLGFALVQDLLDVFLLQQNHWGVTLNTQNTNTASTTLYERVGFRETGERFPVYLYPA